MYTDKNNLGPEQPKIDRLLENTLCGKPVMDKLLTVREVQILREIIAGRTNKEIARILCRSQRTIEYHRNRLMGKLNAHSAADLIKQAIVMGIM